MVKLILRRMVKYADILDQVSIALFSDVELRLIYI